MWCNDDPGLAKPGSTPAGGRTIWLTIGPDRGYLDGQVKSLARFGVVAEPAEPLTTPVPTMPVLCDGRCREQMAGLLSQEPPRAAPVLAFGINAAAVRARLILAGADDAVSGRIAPYELAARMDAAIRSRAAVQGIIKLAGLTFDTGLRKVCWRGELIPLMPREFDLLLVLARNAGLAVSRDTLLHSVWRTAFDPGTNSPEVHIFKLRRRLAALGGKVRVETVKRQGYRLVTDHAPQG
mgnify:CR=1 FL=1